MFCIQLNAYVIISANDTPTARTSVIKHIAYSLLTASFLLISGCTDWASAFDPPSYDPPIVDLDSPAPPTTANPSSAQQPPAAPNNPNTQTSAAPLKPPQHITLLLPLEGSLAASSHAIQQGFMNAYQTGTNDNTIQVNTIDTSKQGIVSAYQQAVNSGADFIVGPLTKSDVQTLITNGNDTTPTLTLNYLNADANTQPNIYQFGLSPFDEAKQAAVLAKQKNLNSVIIIAPKSSWGEGVAQAFQEKWLALGGKVTATMMYSGTNDSLSTQVSNVLQYKESADKTVVPTHREDFDVVFLVAAPETARLIRPLLKFYYAGDIPVYSTSMVYSGKPQPNLDDDLDGITFCDVPAVLASNDTSGNIRLTALGNDAYHIAMQLNQLSINQSTIHGETGTLNLDPQHRVVRQLTCAEFQNGAPVKLSQQ